MPTVCLALKLCLMALVVAFSIKLVRESGGVRALALYVSPIALFVVYVVPSNPLNLPITGAVAAVALVFSTKEWA